MTPMRVTDPYDWGALLRLIRAEFASMEGRINPPSSTRQLTEADLASKARGGEVWVLGTPPRACVVLTVQSDVLYIGKLAVDRAFRGQGLARVLINVALKAAQKRELPYLELETRVELVENQAIFRAMGFTEARRSAHPGFDLPTSITFRRPVD